MSYPGKRRIVFDEVPKIIWIDESLPYGLLRRDLNHDPETNGKTMILDFLPGWEMGKSWNESDIEFLVLNGEVQIADRICKTGHYLFLPSGAPIGPIQSSNGATVLFWHETAFRARDGAPVSPTKPIAETIDIYDPENWKPVREVFEGVTDTSSHDDTTVNAKCIRLRTFTDTGKDTVLFIMPRGFRKPALEVHESAEEAITLRGVLATDPEHVYEAGQYLCWEPRVVHGPVSGWDSIVLSKQHGRYTSPRVSDDVKAGDVIDL